MFLSLPPGFMSQHFWRSVSYSTYMYRVSKVNCHSIQLSNTDVIDGDPKKSQTRVCFLALLNVFRHTWSKVSLRSGG